MVYHTTRPSSLRTIPGVWGSAPPPLCPSPHSYSAIKSYILFSYNNGCPLQCICISLPNRYPSFSNVAASRRTIARSPTSIAPKVGTWTKKSSSSAQALFSLGSPCTKRNFFPSSQKPLASPFRIRADCDPSLGCSRVCGHRGSVERLRANQSREPAYRRCAGHSSRTFRQLSQGLTRLKSWTGATWCGVLMLVLPGMERVGRANDDDATYVARMMRDGRKKRAGWLMVDKK